MNTQFNNMIQVLTYFANQCDMFRPMLEGVESLQQENQYLKQELDKSIVTQNRMQLNTTFSADYANFGVAVATREAGTEPTTNAFAKSEQDDLYNLIKSVISVGRDNYNRKDMEYKLDFYSMIEKLDFDRYVELWDLIESQYAEIEEPSTDEEQDTTLPGDSVSENEATTEEEDKEEEKEEASLLSRFKLKK